MQVHKDVGPTSDQQSETVSSVCIETIHTVFQGYIWTLYEV